MIYVLANTEKKPNGFVKRKLHTSIQADSRSPFIRNFLISPNHINMKIGS
jgi:hypothetical protein